MVEMLDSMLLSFFSIYSFLVLGYFIIISVSYIDAVKLLFFQIGFFSGDVSIEFCFSIGLWG
jgi:hypothetical protein